MDSSNRQDELLSDFRKAFLEVLRLIGEIELLKQNLDLLGRKLHIAQTVFTEKFDKVEFSEEEKQELRLWFGDHGARVREANPTLHPRLAEVTLGLNAVGCENVECHFDSPKELQVTVRYRDRPSVTVDLAASVKANPRNIGHPLVVESIRRYCLILGVHASGVRRHSNRGKGMTNLAKRAKNNLDRVFRALSMGAELKTPEQQGRPELSLPVFMSIVYEKEYFDTLWDTLHQPGVKNAKRGGTKLDLVRRMLREHYPGKNNEAPDEYLKAVFTGGGKTKLPSKGGGEALKNAILAWSLKVSPASARAYESRARRWLVNIANSLPPGTDLALSFTEKEKNDLYEKMQFTFFGIGSMKHYESLNGLIKVENHSASPDRKARTKN